MKKKQKDWARGPRLGPEDLKLSSPSEEVIGR
jgi:hypothetical protein